MLLLYGGWRCGVQSTPYLGSTCGSTPIHGLLFYSLPLYFLPTARNHTHSPFSFPLSVSIYLESIMVRHKKDNFSRGAKKSFTPRPRPRGDNENSSTTSRPPFKAACWDLGHCDPKRCSGKRLMKIGLMRELSIGQRYPGVIVS